MDKQKLEDIIQKVVEEEKMLLVDLELHGSDKNPKIYVFADTMRGITIAECEKLSRKIQEKLESSEFAGLNYSLEVSSPGLDRPLRYDWQYEKNIGRQLRITYEDGEHKATIEGELTGIQDGIITIKTKKQELEIALNHIIKSRVLISW
jgi:ribosome maturation factor RimP